MGGEIREHFFRNSEFQVVLNKENGVCTSFGVCALAKPATLLLLPEWEKDNRDMEPPTLEGLSKDCFWKLPDR